MSVEVARRGYWSNRWQVCCMGGSSKGATGVQDATIEKRGGRSRFCNVRSVVEWVVDAWGVLVVVGSEF